MIDEDTVVAGQSADEQPSAAPEKPSKPEQQQRDESGKFAGKANEQPEASEQPTDEEGKRIPIQALDAEKARRRKAEQENFQLKGYLQALQQQTKPVAAQEPEQPLPDWYAEPDKAFEARMQRALKPVLEKLEAAGSSPRQAIETTSRQIAVSQHGVESVQEAFNAANERMSTDPAFNAAMKARLNASDHPFGELIKWHKEQSALSRIGDDPDAFIEAEVQRRLAEAGGQPAGHAQQRAPVLPDRLPSDFSSARNVGGKGQPAYGGPKPLNEIYGGR